MRDLIRRDPAMGSIGRWFTVAGVGAAGLLNVLGLAVARQRGLVAGSELVDGFYTYLVFSLAVAWVFLIDARGERYRRFDIALPIPGRRLWVSHTIVLSMAAVGVTVLVGGMASAIGWMLSERLPEVLAGFAGQMLLTTARAASTAVLGAVLVQSVAPAASRVSGRGAGLRLAGALVAVPLVAVALRSLPPVFVLVPPVVAVLLGRGTWRTMPAALSFEGASGERRRAPAGGGTLVGARRGGVPRALSLFSLAFRALNKMPLAPIVMIPALFAFGVLLSGAKRAALGGEPYRFAMVFLVSYMLLAGCAVPPMRLFLLDAFPISRKKLFAVSVLPMVILLAIGYAGGRLWGDARLADRELVTYAQIEDAYHIRVPIEYCSIAWDGVPPENTSPWGESHEAWSTPVGRFTGAVLYSPFSAPEGSSPEFVALQLSRAIEAVYGERLEPRTILERYLEVTGEGRTVPRGGAFSLREELAGARPLPLGPVFPILMLVIVAPWFPLLRLYCRTLRAGISLRTKRTVYWSAMGALFLLHIFFYMKGVMGEPGFWEASAFAEIGVRDWAASMPGGALIIWAVCGLAVFALYRFAEAEFGRVESNPGEDEAMTFLMRPTT